MYHQRLMPGVIGRGDAIETNAQPKTAFPLKKRIVCRPKSLPKLWTSCRRPPDSPRVPCEPVSVCNRSGLCPTAMEIEKWRPETGAWSLREDLRAVERGRHPRPKARTPSTWVTVSNHPHFGVETRR